MAAGRTRVRTDINHTVNPAVKTQATDPADSFRLDDATVLVNYLEKAARINPDQEIASPIDVVIFPSRRKNKV